MKTLSQDFNFFDFTAKELSDERKIEIKAIRENNERKIQERNEKINRQQRYLKATALRLG